MPDLYRYTDEELREIDNDLEIELIDTEPRHLATQAFIIDNLRTIRRTIEERKKPKNKPCACGEITHSRDPQDAA